MESVQREEEGEAAPLVVSRNCQSLLSAPQSPSQLLVSEMN